jgi:hypothetical protein
MSKMYVPKYKRDPPKQIFRMFNVKDSLIPWGMDTVPKDKKKSHKPHVTPQLPICPFTSENDYFNHHEMLCDSPLQKTVNVEDIKIDPVKDVMEFTIITKQSTAQIHLETAPIDIPQRQYYPIIRFPQSTIHFNAI